MHVPRDAERSLARERGGAAPEPWPCRAGAVEGAEAGRVAREGQGGPSAVPVMDDL